MNINEFKANFAEPLRPTLYSVEIQGLPEKLKFVCKIAQLPGKTITPIIIPYSGHEIKIAGDLTFEDLNLTIILDTDMNIKTDIEDWMEEIRQSFSSGGQTPNLYKREAFIIQKDSADAEIFTYHFFGMWPTVLDPVELGFDNRDTLAEMTVTFAYDYWKRD